MMQMEDFVDVDKANAIEEAVTQAKMESEHRAKELRQRMERAALVNDVVGEVLRHIEGYAGDMERYGLSRRAMSLRLYVEVRSLIPHLIGRILTFFDPERGIKEIEARMYADPGSDKWRSYWTGHCGKKAQEELRRLYARREKRQMHSTPPRSNGWGWPG